MKQPAGTPTEKKAGTGASFVESAINMKSTPMAKAIHDFPEFILEAQELSRTFSPDAVKADKVVVLGLGGSAIGGDLVQALAEKMSLIPIQVIRGGEIPNYVDNKTLVIVVSYSGNTLETLNSMQAALYKSEGKVIAISTGGLLKKDALSKVFPHLQIPGGLMPRAALPFTFIPLIHILQRLVNFPDQSMAIAETVSVLREMREQISSSRSQVASLARALHDRLPIIYASTPAFAPAARRWKGQINENAKQPAFYGVFPEVTHNDIVGFSERLPISGFISTVFLRDSDESDGTKKLIEFTQKAITETGATVHEVWSKGVSFLAKLLSLCYYADYATLHLAEVNGVDPSSTTVIDGLKQALKAKAGGN